MKVLLGLVLISLLLVAGCTGGEQAPQAKETQSKGSVTTPIQSGGEVQSGTEEKTPESKTWDLGNMMSSAVPTYCTVDYSSGEFSGSSKMWIKGDNLRVETTTKMPGSNEDIESVMIAVGDTTYIKNTDGNVLGSTTQKDCDWVSLNTKELEACMPEDEQTEETGYDFESSYEETPSSYNCAPGVFGDEKFHPEGKVCDLTKEFCSLYKGMANGTGIPGMSPEDLCGDLEGDQKATCMQQFNLD